MVQKSRNSLVIQSLLAILATEVVLVVLVMIPKGSSTLLRFDNSVQIGVFSAIPLFVIAVLQIRNAVQLQKAGFIKDYVSKLHTDKELSEAYHYLVYTYPNDLYEKVINATPEQVQAMQGERMPGCRLYDPM